MQMINCTCIGFRINGGLPCKQEYCIVEEQIRAPKPGAGDLGDFVETMKSTQK